MKKILIAHVQYIQIQLETIDMHTYKALGV